MPSSALNGPTASRCEERMTDHKEKTRDVENLASVIAWGIKEYGEEHGIKLLTEVLDVTAKEIADAFDRGWDAGSEATVRDQDVAIAKAVAAEKERCMEAVLRMGGSVNDGFTLEDCVAAILKSES